MALIQLSRRLPNLVHRRLPSLSVNFSSEPPSTPSPDPTASPETETPNQEQPDELTILCDAVLKQVPEHGWTDKAIAAALRDVDWSPAAKGMLARGPVQVAELFVRRCNVQLAERLAVPQKDDPSSPSERAAFAIRTRLSMNEPFHASWAQALALQTLPQNAPRAVRSSALMVDEIAHFAGYRSPDFAWYMDRAALGVMYHSTELFWLTDKSEGRADTWRFLENNIRRSGELRSGFGSAFAKVMGVSDAVTGTVSTIVQTTRRTY